MKTYIQYLFRGAAQSESDEKVVESRDIQAAIATAPPGAFGFGFHNIYEGELEIDGRTVELTSYQEDWSGWHYIDAVVLDEEGLRAEGLTGFAPGQIIKTRSGNCVQFDSDCDQIVTSQPH